MTNLIEKYVPKKYQEAVQDLYKDCDGWWVELKPEYMSTTTETSTIHEYTVADMKKQFKTIVKREVEIVEEEVIEPIIVAPIAPKGEEVAENFNHIPFTKEEVKNAKVVSVHFDSKNLYQVEVENEVEGTYRIQRLRKDGQIDKRYNEELVWLSAINAVYEFQEVAAEEVQEETKSKSMSERLSEIIVGLTEKESDVLLSIISNSELEYGLPCDKQVVALESGVKGNALSGVISSLTKKGYVEPYDYDGFKGEFHLTEDLFEKVFLE